jgi:hypothetical protein
VCLRPHSGQTEMLIKLSEDWDIIPSRRLVQHDLPIVRRVHDNHCAIGAWKSVVRPDLPSGYALPAYFLSPTLYDRPKFARNFLSTSPRNSGLFAHFRVKTLLD